MRRSNNALDEDRAISLEGILELCSRNVRLVTLVTLACLSASLLWLATKDPVYRARATLILDEDSGASGVLSDLVSLTKAPRAAAEMELLRSRTTAERTVAAVRADVEGLAYEDELQRHQGLRTRVEDPTLRPLKSLLAGGRRAGLPGLRANVETPVGETLEEDLWVEFTRSDTVRVGTSRWFGLIGDVEETTFVPGRPIEYRGARLTLRPEGDLTGRRFRIVHSSHTEAVERLMRSMRVRETQRNSGVMELTFDDSDPVRAAATANAVCHNYLDRNELRGEKRASQTVDFIHDQLQAQNEALHQAEDEVVELQKNTPRAIDVSKSAEKIIERLAALEVLRVQDQLMQISLRQALDRLRGGDVDALSRITIELADPITTTYVEGIASLAAEYALQDRSDVGAFRSMLQKKTLELEVQRDALVLEIGALRDAVSAVDDGEVQAVGRIAFGQTMAGDPLLAGYLEGLAQLQSERDLLARQFTDSHPDLVQLVQRIDAARERIGRLLSNRLAGLESRREEQDALLAVYRDQEQGYPGGERVRITAALQQLRDRTATHLDSRLDGLQAHESSLAEQIASIEADLGELPAEERRIADPLRRLTAQTEIVKFLLESQLEAQITRAATVASAEFIDPATPPLARHGPSIPLHSILGLAVGLSLSMGLSYAKESLSRGVFTAAELEVVTELPVLGTIPDFRRGRYRVRGAGENFVPLRDDPEGLTAEAYRSMRTNLKFAMSGAGELRILACTSCTQGEGKSATNIGLALAFARNDKRVLLIDSDLRKPAVHRYLGLELSPGLSDTLEDRISWRECVRRDVQENLDVIPAGKQPASPGDLLDSRALGELMEELREEYDLIVFDVPPVLAVSDFNSIAARLDGVLLLVRSNKVSAHVVGSAANRLRQAGATLIGTVLNAVGSSLANGRYGYGYDGCGYGYHHSRGHGERAEESRQTAS